MHANTHTIWSVLLAPHQYWDDVVFPPQAVEEEDKMTPEQLAIKNVGKQVTKKFQASDKNIRAKYMCYLFI